MMIFPKHILSILIAMLLLISACSSTVMKNLPVEKKMQIANEFFDREKYHKAIPYYQNIVFEKNSVYTSEAQMKLADSYFEENRFAEARFEYQEMIRLFDDYDNISKAYFMIGVCWFNESLPAHYTQEETRKAIDAFETFLEKFPFDERKKDAIDYINECHYKLLEKKYNNGYTYYKMYDYSAALLYFDEIIELGNKDELDRLSLYYSALIHYKREDFQKAKQTTEKLSAKYPDSKETKKMQNLLKIAP